MGTLVSAEFVDTPEGACPDRQNEYAWFLQDEIRVLPRLSMMLGLRHEIQSNLDDHHDLAPRVALSFGSADGKTILRAGGGVFYQRQPIAMEAQSLLLNGSHLHQIQGDSTW